MLTKTTQNTRSLHNNSIDLVFGMLTIITPDTRSTARLEFQYIAQNYVRVLICSKLSKFFKIQQDLW